MAFGAGAAAGAAAGPLPNMSANGLPNCSKSSEALALELGMARLSWTGASNRSTIGAELAVGAAARNGFVDGPLAPGDDTLDCCKGTHGQFLKKSV